MFTIFAKSKFVRGIRKARKQSTRQRVAVDDSIVWYKSLQKKDLPLRSYMHIIGSDGTEHFTSVGSGVFSELVGRFSLGNTSKIVDMGCGCGRVAIPFSRLITKGRYWGFDVWKDGIIWCRDNISTISQNFEFVVVPVVNDYYFDKFDPAKRNTFTLNPVPDAGINLCFAISLFTHLTKVDCQSYLHEVRRILAPSGAAFITCFIVDKYFADYSKRTGNHSSLEQHESGVFHAYAGQDFFSGFTQQVWLQMLQEAGLQVVSAEAGKWAEKPGARPYQDTYVLVRDDWSSVCT